MKKSLIAAAGATLAVAAMPAVGVFAVESDYDSFTDTVIVGVDQSCVFKSEVTSGQSTVTSTDADRTYRKLNVKPGETVYFGDGTGDAQAEGSTEGRTIKFFCTNDGGTTKNVAWNIYAVGGDGTTASTVMESTGSGTDIATGTNTTGTASQWAMKITSAGADATNSWNDWHVVPSSRTKVAGGTTTTGAADITFAPEYRVYVGTNQEADTYTGKVTYTLAAEITAQP